jgi:hypothetical protein
MKPHEKPPVDVDKTMRQRTLWIFMATAIALTAFGSACNRGAANTAAKEQKPGGPDSPTSSTARREYAVPVGVVNLERRPISAYVTTVGSVAPARSMAVRAEESGRIQFIKEWREGERVEQGTVLARIDEEETSRQIEMAMADLESARQQLELSLKQLDRTTADFERSQVMFNHGQISRKMYEEREFLAQQAKISQKEGIIRVSKAGKQLERYQIQALRKVVRAPMTGYLVARTAIENRQSPSAADSAERLTEMEGRMVGSNQVICGVMDMTRVLIRCDVTSKDIGKIAKSQKVQAFVYTDREVAVDGEVVDVSPIMDIQTRAFKVDVTAENQKGVLRAGMFARVNVIITTRRDAVVVSRKVLQRRNNEEIVFVVGDEERAERRPVKLGLENPDEVEVLEGLRAGERLITLGFETLQDKIKVKIVETDPAVAGDDRTSSATKVAHPADGRA